MPKGVDYMTEGLIVNLIITNYENKITLFI